MRKIKNILVLAGGESSRFWPLQNKSYFNFLNAALINHLLVKISEYGSNIFIVANPSNIRVANTTVGNSPATLIEQIKTVPGQAGALLSAKNHIEGEVLILNANDIFDFSYLNSFINKIERDKPDFLFFAKKVQSYFPGGYLKFNKNKLIGIAEKPNPGTEPSQFVKLVVDYFADFKAFIKILETLKKTSDDLYEQGITKLIDNSSKTDFIEYASPQPWLTIKYPWHVLSVMSYFLKTLGNEVRIGKNVKIAKTAKVVGPCFIGDNTIIGDFAMIRDCHIGKNCLIGGYSEVTRSYLGDNVSLHRNYVGDSVIGDNVLFGAQTATANFRFDGKTIRSTIKNTKIDTSTVKLGAMIGSNSKIGVNATLLPGIKVGRGCLIGPGEVIQSDIKDDTFVFKGKQKINQK